MRKKTFTYEHGSFENGRPKTLHRVKAEKALGKPLPLFAVVHHADENPLNNENSNLVICPDEAYHNLLHIRLRAYKACGNADFRKCYVCKEYDILSSLQPLKKPGRILTTFFHYSCKTARQTELYHKRKARLKNAS